MRYLVAAAAIVMLSSSATAEEFNATGAQILTHRGTDLELTEGVNQIDKKNKMTCVSDSGCSLVVETQFMGDNRNQFSMSGTICTYVDDVPADPGCLLQVAVTNAMSFQGKPALKKGNHVVYTTYTLPSGWHTHVLGYQLVYTLYQHE